MPFYREFEGGVKVVKRDRTGLLPPPDPGVIQTEDGRIVGSTAETGAIDPGTEVKVNLPGPKERLFDSRGFLTPRWYRFFSELYRRTGGVNDNVNFIGTLRNLTPSVASLSLTTTTPVVSKLTSQPATSLSLSGKRPTVALTGSVAPSTATMRFTVAEPAVPLYVTPSAGALTLITSTPS